MGKAFNPQAVLFAGCGNMGSAILDGAIKEVNTQISDESQSLKSFLKPKNVTVLERFESGRVQMFQAQGVNWVKNIDDLNGEFDVIILAVKPQDSAVIMKSLSQYISKSGMVISIMAGVNIATMESYFSSAAIIRAMPNTPVSIAQGTTGITASESSSDDQLNWALELFGTLGLGSYFASEAMIDAVTAVSGSGPAYLFYLAEAMIEQAVNIGVDSSQAKMLVAQTLKGASMLLQESVEGASYLREKVTSKGGTTFAATEEFDAQGVKEGIKSGIQKAFERSKELGS